MKKYKEHFLRDVFSSFLVGVVQKNYKKWKKKYPNITGIDVSKKITLGVESEVYAIVFSVIVKTDLLNEGERIPSHLKVKYHGKFVPVPTDVIYIGDTELTYIAPGRNAFQFNNVDKRGTIGLIVLKGGLPHILSNMHVLGWTFLAKTQSIIDKPIDLSRPPDVSSLVNNTIQPTGYFRSGMVNSEIDAAIALIPQHLFPFINDRRDIISVNDPIILPTQPVTTPIPMRMLGNISGFKDSRIVSTTAVMTFGYPLGPQNLVKLIKLEPCCSVPGDSGSAVYDPDTGRIVGIVLGRDKSRRFTYVIPYATVVSLLQIF